MPTNIYRFNYYTIEVINDPKINMNSSLINSVITECTELSRNSFNDQNISKDLISYHVLETSTTIIGRDQSGKIIGFGSSRVIPVGGFQIIFLQCIVTANEHKKKGFNKSLIPFRIIEGVHRIRKQDPDINENNILIAGRTQNPVVYRTCNRLLGMFPHPNGLIDPRIKPVGRKFAESLYADDCHHNPSIKEFVFNDDTFVSKSTYKSELQQELHESHAQHASMPLCHDLEIDQYMKKNLDWNNGDALILLGYYRDEKVQKLVRIGEQIMLTGSAETSAHSPLVG